MAEALVRRSEEQMRGLIRDLIRELAPTPDGLAAENPRLVEDLGYHSLALLELAFTLEDEFGLDPIDQETAKTIVTAGDIEEYVMRRALPA
jgi:acyl carrier protein